MNSGAKPSPLHPNGTDLNPYVLVNRLVDALVSQDSLFRQGALVFSYILSAQLYLPKWDAPEKFL